MLLAIDIDNTNITFGGFLENGSEFVARINIDASKTSDDSKEVL